MSLSKATCFMVIFLMMLNLSRGVIVFQQPTNFGTMQIQLTTTAGFISTGTSNTFNFANPGYENVTSLGLALCGYDIPNPNALQFRAEASFDDVKNSIVVLILPLNSTKLAFINYYVIIVTQQVSSFVAVQNTCKIYRIIGVSPPYNPYNSSMLGRIQTYTLASPFVMNSTSKVTAIPFIRSVNNIVAETYNYFQITSIVSANNNQFTLNVLYNYTYQSEACLSVVYYWDTQGLKINLVNTSYSSNFLIINSTSSTQNLASVSQQNFTLNNMYGPIFNRKCLVGFQNFKMLASTRQTISFNLTGNGIYGIISSSNYQVGYAWLCMAQITCQGLLAQYYPAINDCQVVCTINNCSICQTSTSCSNCSSGFYVNTLYRCSNCMLNCINCTNSTVCLQCANGFYYNNTVCLPCAQFCTSCISGSCRTCQTGYYANGAQCIFCASVLPNCQLCVTGTVCSVCPQGYYSSGNSGGCVLCSQVLQGCNTCSIASICNTCQPGYYLNMSTCKTCVFSVSSCCPFFIGNCSVCKNTTICANCSVGYYLSNNNQSCTPCSNTLANCLACTTSSLCLFCAGTFFLNPYNQCISCSSSITQCSVCTNSTYCSVCLPPFIMVNGSCLNCPIWPTNNLYYLDQNNVCQGCSMIADNCIRCNEQQMCTQCSDLYFLNNNICSLCSDLISNCLSCNSNAACSICSNGYFPDLTNSSTCMKCGDKINYCTTCTDVLDSNKNTYSIVCMGCEREYYLNSSICSPCIDSINFCLVCSNNFQCNQCEIGYFLSSTMTCIPCAELIIGCNSCQSSSICLSCVAGYYLINNYCTQCRMALNNCFSCGKINSTLTCSACLTGYYLGLNFNCQQCNSTIQFCKSCTSSSTCIECISGYTVNYNQSCSPCTYLIPYCEYCTQTCIKCLDNYILDNYGECQNCNFYISGCSICEYELNNITNQNDLNCTTCLSGYLIYLSGALAKCVACNLTIPNCISCVNLTYCSSCNNLSFINSKNTCSLCSIYLPNCIYCNGSSICLMCAGSYYVNSNQVCEFCDPSQFGNDGSILKLNLCLSCKYFARVATCLSCIFGYYVTANGCTSCTGMIPNCLNCASNNLCIQCSSGYYLSSTNTQCINCPIALTYCSNCDLNGICLQCNSDCYLNSTSNTCIKCFQITSGCNKCTGNATCSGCADGYYMSGLSCLSCAAVFKNCLLCNNDTVCILYSSNYTVSTSNNILTHFATDVWMYIALGCFGFIALMIALCIICKKCKSRQEEAKSKDLDNATKSHTERQLHHDMEAIHDNNLKIGHEQLCQHCKSNKFDVMNIELLCSMCQKKKRQNRDHIIRQLVAKKSSQHQRQDRIKQKDKKISKSPKMVPQSQPKSKKSSNEEKLIKQQQSDNGKNSDRINQISLKPKLKNTQSECIDAKERNLTEMIDNTLKNQKKNSNSYA